MIAGDYGERLRAALKQRRDGVDLEPMRMPQVPIPQEASPGIGESLINAVGTLGSAYLNRPQDPMGHALSKLTPDFKNQPLTANSTYNTALPGYARGGYAPAGRPIIDGEEGEELEVNKYGSRLIGTQGAEVRVPDESSYIIPTDKLVSALSGSRGMDGAAMDENPYRRAVVDAMKPMGRTDMRDAMPPAGMQERSRVAPNPAMVEAMGKISAPVERPVDSYATGGESRGRYTTPEAQLEARINNRERLVSDPSLANAPENHPNRLRSAAVNALLGISDTARNNPNATTGQVLAGGVAPGIAGAINPKMLADYENQSEIAPMQGMLDRQEARRDRALKRRQIESQINENESQAEARRGEPARAAAKTQAEEQDKKQSRLISLLGQMDEFDPDSQDPHTQAFVKELQDAGVPVIKKSKGETWTPQKMNGYWYKRDKSGNIEPLIDPVTKKQGVDTNDVADEFGLTPKDYATMGRMTSEQRISYQKEAREVNSHNNETRSKIQSLTDENNSIGQEMVQMAQARPTDDDWSKDDKKRYQELQDTLAKNKREMTSLSGQFRDLPPEPQEVQPRKVQTRGKVATEADIQAYMTEHKVSREQAIKDAQDDGYVIK